MKTFEYLIFFNSSQGFGNAVVALDYPLNSASNIRQTEHMLEDKCILDGCVIASFQLISTNE